MASGCILSMSCPVCQEIVCEDDWTMRDDVIIHLGCQRQYIKEKYGMSESQFLRLCGSQELRKDIKELKEIEADRHKYTMDQLNELDRRLIAIEKKES